MVPAHPSVSIRADATYGPNTLHLAWVLCIER